MSSADAELDESAEGADGFNVASDEAYVASATVCCGRCSARTEVICIHCGSGTVSGEALTRFTLSDVWDMDDALASQLRRWPTYRRLEDGDGYGDGAGVADGDVADFANHCARCGAPQDDLELHSEPDSPFFDIPAAAAGTIRLTRLSGTIRLSGDEHYSID
ncbi:MAG: hypothetical protein ACREUG_14360 [Steroidobacteraceae bacterium]